MATAATPLRHVSDTALWVAMYRAIESDRPDALFHDPYARRMAGERGAAIVAAMPRGRTLAWPMIVRTAVIDEVVMRCVTAGARTVVNLAAGLDVRAYRLSLPSALRWFDVDLPDMIAYRREHLGPAHAVCVHDDVEADLADPSEREATLARITDEDAPALVITEGLLVYLPREQVRSLAETIHARPAARWWLLDLASPLLLDMLKKTWQPHLSAANAPMVFAPAEGSAFFASSGWREAEFRSTWDESLRLKRSARLAWLWNALGRLRSRRTREAFRRMSGVVLLERT
jgi:methyltransferase (TIGR00027 family)